MQSGGRGLRPQRCQIECPQVGAGLLQRLRRPGLERGADVGLHGVGIGVYRSVGLRCAAYLCLQLQLCCCRGQGAVQRGLGRQVQCLPPRAGRGSPHLAIGGGLQGHGRLCLQCGLGAVLALGQFHTVDVQLVLGQVMAVVAAQGMYLHRPGASPFDVRDLEGQVHAHWQHPLRGRLCGRRIGLRCGGDAHAGHLHQTQRHSALPQRCQVPADAGIAHFYRQAGAAPAQPVQLAAAAQGAAHAAALQTLPGGQPARGLGQRGGQRAVLACPPPAECAQGAQQQHQPHYPQQGCRTSVPQPAQPRGRGGAGAAGLRCCGRKRIGRRRGASGGGKGVGACVGGDGGALGHG